MGAFKPAMGKKFKLKAKLEGTPKDGEARFRIAWVDDLPALKSKKGDSVLDDRVPTIATCKEWRSLLTPINNNEAEVEAPSTVPHDAWNLHSAKEIFACIRAEYMYIAKEGYTKIQSRSASGTGIDHLFVKKGSRSVIVESKTISELAVIKDVSEGPPNAFLDQLGKGHKLNPNAKGQVLFATQMTEIWINKCLADLAHTSTGAQKRQVQAVRTEMAGDEPPKRVVNIYGGLNWDAHDAYKRMKAEAQKQFKQLPKSTQTRMGSAVASKFVEGTETGERTGGNELLYLHKKWITADPTRGRFYLLPGQYRLGTRASCYTMGKDPVKDVDFADDKFKDEEFFFIENLDDDIIAAFERPKPPKSSTNATGK
jgi:hypothetical protein